VITVLAVTAVVTGFKGGDARARSSALAASDGESLRVTRPQCASAKRAVAFYSRRVLYWYERMGAAVPRKEALQGRDLANDGSGRCPRYLAHVRQDKAYALRKAHERWLKEHTLKDVPFGDGNNAWLRAVREVQVVFPGTEAWLKSCSWAEGKWGRWVGYQGVPYSTWLRDSNTVGGPLQFRYRTFTGMFRRGAEYVRAHGYRLPVHLRDMTTAWRSALGQAIAGGWARYTGNDDNHWSASWNNGCR